MYYSKSRLWHFWAAKKEGGGFRLRLRFCGSIHVLLHLLNCLLLSWMDYGSSAFYLLCFLHQLRLTLRLYSSSFSCVNDTSNEICVSCAGTNYSFLACNLQKHDFFHESTKVIYCSTLILNFDKQLECPSKILIIKTYIYIYIYPFDVIGWHFTAILFIRNIFMKVYIFHSDFVFILLILNLEVSLSFFFSL